MKYRILISIETDLENFPDAYGFGQRIIKELYEDWVGFSDKCEIEDIAKVIE